ncbi:NAD(P)H-dependent oxidoreductase subunit E [bacterium]|nr:NAD(P)H-dependent oxidoreductase subunit E [bacterium]
MNTDEIIPVIQKFQERRGGLISILEEIQSKYGYLPEDALRQVADKTKHDMVDIYGVATFYRAFRLKPRGQHLASVCLGTACHVRGGPGIVEEFESRLKVKGTGQTTADKEFTLETVRCLGACALAPIVVVDGHYFPNVSTSQVDEIISKTRNGLDKVALDHDDRIFPLEVNCPLCNHSLADHKHLIDGHPSIRLTVSYGAEHGWVRLSSLYGSYTIESGNEIPIDAVVHFFCPHCHAELIGAWNCVVCDAPMVPMIVCGGGIVQICSRRGCKSHLLDLEGKPG